MHNTYKFTHKCTRVWIAQCARSFQQHFRSQKPVQPLGSLYTARCCVWVFHTVCVCVRVCVRVYCSVSVSLCVGVPVCTLELFHLFTVLSLANSISSAFDNHSCISCVRVCVCVCGCWCAVISPHHAFTCTNMCLHFLFMCVWERERAGRGFAFVLSYHTSWCVSTAGDLRS